MEGLFIPGITTEMFRNGCLEGIVALMADGEIYDIDYPSMQEPCEDCVSRQAVLDIVNNPLNIRLDEIVKKLPLVTPERPKGEWISTNPQGKSDNIVCTVCGYDSIADFNFCPNCGADMRG